MKDEAFDRAASLAVGPMQGQGVDRVDALELLALAEEDLESVLFHADRVRRRHRGDTVRLCGIAAAKVGRCPEDCAWCSQSARHKAAVGSHGLLDEEELLSQARRAARTGATSFGFVTSGAAPTAQEIDRLCRCIERLSRDGAVTVCASLGMIDEPTARRLAAAGCRRYNHNLETSRRHYEHVVGTHCYDDRLTTARAAKAAGMELCSGGLFGIGETAEDRVDLALEVRGLGAETVPINFLNPIAGTPAASSPRLRARECLAIIAMARFAMPQACIKVAGGREVNLRDLQSWMFRAGADGFILGDYLTTSGRAIDDDLRMIRDLGLRSVS